MKKIIFAIIILFFVAGLNAAVTLRYYNKDSQEHKMRVKISGTWKTVKFGSSRTATITIQGGTDSCLIETICKKEKLEINVKSGDYLVIEDGCITIK